MLDNLRIFVVAAEQQSLSKAAEHLGMTLATVSRRVHELEQKLGCELFHRSNKGLTLTPIGIAYYDESAGYIHELDMRLSNLEDSLNSLEGELRVMAPTNIGSGPLDAFWKSFIANNSGISLNVILGDPSDDVISHQVDIAIRSGPQQNSSLIQKKIGTITPVLVAAASARELEPEDINDLEALPSIAAQLFSDWHLIKDNEAYRCHKKHNHISNDMNVSLNLVKAGAGIALLPLSMVHAELEIGELRRVLPSWSGVPRDICLLWPNQRTLSVRAVRFRDELIGYLRNQQWFNMVI